MELKVIFAAVFVQKNRVRKDTQVGGLSIACICIIRGVLVL
jgi:hypothetical protein